MLIFLSQLPVYAAGEFELKIQVPDDSSFDRSVYYDPPGNVIKIIGSGRGARFRVALKNVSSSPQTLSIEGSYGGSKYGGASGMSHITFEITDENGNNNVVSKKVGANQSKDESYLYLNPGKTKNFDILLTSSEWDNAFELSDQGAKDLHARAAYKNGPSVIYSDYYDVRLDD
jgi:hypothetical protein